LSFATSASLLLLDSSVMYLSTCLQSLVACLAYEPKSCVSRNKIKSFKSHSTHSNVAFVFRILEIIVFGLCLGIVREFYLPDLQIVFFVQFLNFGKQLNVSFDSILHYDVFKVLVPFARNSHYYKHFIFVCQQVFFIFFKFFFHKLFRTMKECLKRRILCSAAGLRRRAQSS